MFKHMIPADVRTISKLWIILAILCLNQAFGRQANPEIRLTDSRAVYSLNANWRYLEESLQNPADLPSDENKWKKINLPHTWNAFDAVDVVPGYRRSASWYRREIFVPTNVGSRRFLLSFEGVNISSKVFVNRQLAGSHVGGYVGFDVDITPFVKAGEANLIEVRADNSYDLTTIPSQKSDFFIYGGITRNVWLKILPSVYVASLRIRTPRVTKSTGETECEVEVKDFQSRSGKLTVQLVITNKDAKEVARTSAQVSMQNKSGIALLKSPAVKNPDLWSPSSPTLYSATVSLKEGNKVLDQQIDRFGYRWYEFKEHGPFYLNGERLLLRGTHRHEDYAGYGMAIPDSLHRKDMRMIKEMGANFVRLAHYPQAPEVYRACDELGLLVWDELPWCRGGLGGDEWKANTKRLLNEQINQNINHPSIIIWSLGNESYWVPDIPGGDNSDSLRVFINELNSIAHTLDPRRLTAVRKIDDGAGIVDVFSPSIWAGWYSSFYKNYEASIASARGKYRRLLHVEYGGDSHVGRHTESPVTGNGIAPSGGGKTEGKPIRNISLNSDWSENYIVDLFDWHLHVSEQLDWLSGNAQWAFKDFGTPLRPENPIPYINQKGLVDREGNPKDAYYVFKSYWTTSPAFCYIESHTWTERNGPAGVAKKVQVFSNCAEVELLVNGKSQGVKKRNIKNYPACGLSWDVLFKGGENSLVAVGYEGKRKVTEDEMQVHFSSRKIGEPANIVLSSEDLASGHVLITATAVDINGRRCLDYNKRIYFTNLGAGELIINRGTPTGSSIIEMANGLARIEFVPASSRKMLVEARNQDFKGSYLIIE
ncbi:MAG: glycoside hydrolase family 2 TIM barrel-domain containing protein [Bacteroidota bacterium]